MNEGVKVYILTTGYYSDRHIVGVFASRSLAEEAAAVDDESDIEEYEVLGALPELVTRYHRSADVTRAGLTNTHEVTDTFLNFEGAEHAPVEAKSFARKPATPLDGHRTWVSVSGTDETAVAKAFTERVAAAKAAAALPPSVDRGHYKRWVGEEYECGTCGQPWRVHPEAFFEALAAL